MRETEIGEAAVAWLESTGWDVYQEVTIGGKRADVVGRFGSASCVVECKTSLSFDLLAQARNWRFKANYVYVAVPRAKRSDGRTLAIDYVAANLGIGVVEFDAYNPDRIRVLLRASLARVTDGKILAALRPEHKTAAPAGTNGGGYHIHTEYKETCKRILEFVSVAPPRAFRLKYVLANIAHHYASKASAMSTLKKRIRDGAVPGVEMSEDGYLFLNKDPGKTKRRTRR